MGTRKTDMVVAVIPILMIVRLLPKTFNIISFLSPLSCLLDRRKYNSFQFPLIMRGYFIYHTTAIHIITHFTDRVQLLLLFSLNVV